MSVKAHLLGSIEMRKHRNPQSSVASSPIQHIKIEDQCHHPFSAFPEALSAMSENNYSR
jgi:hypothetical protein